MLVLNILIGETKTFSIQESSDIAEQDVLSSNDSTIYYCTGCWDIWIGMYATSNIYSGIRFPNVTIPPGVTINSAFITVKPTSEQSDEIKIKVSGEAVDSSFNFLSANYEGGNGTIVFDSDSTALNVFSRMTNLTAASIDVTVHKVWRPDSLESIQVSEVVRELYNMDGWNSGNPMTFIIQDNSGLTDQNCSSSSFCDNKRIFQGHNGNNDGDSTFFSPKLTISYTPPEINHPPTNILLSDSTIFENENAGMLIGTFSTTDVDSSESHTYSLAVTETFPDNNYFYITENQLRSNYPFNYENQNSYSIRVRSTDSFFNFVDNSFNIIILDIYEDISIPTVQSVTSSTTNGWYNELDEVGIIITFNEYVTISGNPELILETGAQDAVINCSSQTPSNSISCLYVIGSGHMSDDLEYVSESSLNVNGGSILDVAGNIANLILPLPGSENSLSFNKDIMVDTESPSVELSTDSKEVTNISPINVTAIFSEDVINFDLSKVDVSGSNATSSFNTISSSRYTFDVTPDSEGEIQISISTTSITDSAKNYVYNSPILIITYDNTPPSLPVISSSITSSTTATSPIPINVYDTMAES